MRAGAQRASVFAVGGIWVAAQTVLMRELLVACRGNELMVVKDLKKDGSE